jgi:hypothetical protein
VDGWMMGNDYSTTIRASVFLFHEGSKQILKTIIKKFYANVHHHVFQRSYERKKGKMKHHIVENVFFLVDTPDTTKKKQENECCCKICSQPLPIKKNNQQQKTLHNKVKRLR